MYLKYFNTALDAHFRRYGAYIKSLQVTLNILLCLDLRKEGMKSCFACFLNVLNIHVIYF